MPALVEVTPPVETRRQATVGIGQVPHGEEKVMLRFFCTWMYEGSQIDSSAQSVGENGRFATSPRPRLSLHATGWQPSEEEIRRDVRLLLRDNFVNFLGTPAA